MKHQLLAVQLDMQISGHAYSIQTSLSPSGGEGYRVRRLLRKPDIFRRTIKHGQKKRAERGPTRSGGSALRIFYSGEELDELLADLETEIDVAELSAKDRKKLQATLAHLRHLATLHPQHPLAQKFEASFRPPRVPKHSTRTFESWMATALQKKELARKYDTGGKSALARKTRREAERAERSAKKALMEGR
ncbi:MAG: hypothetical protein JO208_02290 [Alphaproteobacteria bacterium]|nr:hypothetical protein [Alphaproteobacteria bacterium]